MPNRFETFGKDTIKGTTVKVTDDMMPHPSGGLHEPSGSHAHPHRGIHPESHGEADKIIKEHMKKKAKQFRERVEGCMCSDRGGVDGCVGEFLPLEIASPQSEAADRERKP